MEKKKRVKILVVLLLIILIFIISSAIAWYRKDVQHNVILNEKIDSFNADYLYRNYVAAKPDIKDRPFFGNEKANIVMISYLDSGADSTKRFLDEDYPILKKEFIDTGRLRFVVKYYLDSTDLDKNSERFKAYSYLECARKTSPDFGRIYFDIIKDGANRTDAQSQEQGSKMKKCMETENFENIKVDAMEVENLGMIGLNPRFYIGINGNVNTALDGIPTITRINQTVRLYEIELGE